MLNLFYSVTFPKQSVPAFCAHCGIVNIRVEPASTPSIIAGAWVPRQDRDNSKGKGAG